MNRLPFSAEVANLPLYDTSAVAWERKQLENAYRFDKQTFVRRIVLRRGAGTESLGLLETLEAADGAFAKAAAACGARVVKHTWGLAALPAGRSFTSERSVESTKQVLPRGFGLVAEVEIIHHRISDTTLFSDNLVSGISNYRNSIVPGEIYWDDSGHDQFIVKPAVENRPDELVLHDIDPRIQRK